MTSAQVLRPWLSPDLDAMEQVLARVAATNGGEAVVTSVRHFPRREAQWQAIPNWVQSELANAYRERGITECYSDQAKVAELIRTGNNVVVVTPTGSGKTLCYNLPIVNAILENANTREPGWSTRSELAPSCRDILRGHIDS
jgi:DEAD/DEAH box helicase domain-containing protein